MESVIEYRQSLENESRLRWLHENHPRKQEIKGQVRALVAWRDEVVGHVAHITGSDKNVVKLDKQIQDRRNELLACGLAEEGDGIMEELRSLRKFAGRDCVMQIIDHPLVVWILQKKGEVMKRIRADAKESFKGPDSPASP